MSNLKWIITGVLMLGAPAIAQQEDCKTLAFSLQNPAQTAVHRVCEGISVDQGMDGLSFSWGALSVQVKTLTVRVGDADQPALLVTQQGPWAGSRQLKLQYQDTPEVFTVTTGVPMVLDLRSGFTLQLVNPAGLQEGAALVYDPAKVAFQVTDQTSP